MPVTLFDLHVAAPIILIYPEKELSSEMLGSLPKAAQQLVTAGARFASTEWAVFVMSWEED